MQNCAISLPCNVNQAGELEPASFTFSNTHTNVLLSLLLSNRGCIRTGSRDLAATMQPVETVTTAERKQLLTRLQASPFFKPFRAVLAACNEEGAFDNTNVPYARGAISTSCLTFDKFAAKHGLQDLDDSTQSKQTGYIKAEFEKYKQCHTALDNTREHFKHHLNLSLEELKYIHPYSTQEEKYRSFTLLHIFSRTKNDLNKRYLPEKRKASRAKTEPSASTKQADADEGSAKKPPAKRKKRGTLPKEAVQTLKEWLYEHLMHPYPSDDEKQMLSKKTGLKVTQVNYWFINARVRIWRPMIETMNANNANKADK